MTFFKHMHTDNSLDILAEIFQIFKTNNLKKAILASYAQHISPNISLCSFYNSYLNA